MPSDVIIKVKCPVYLIRFQESYFEIPQGQPICYPKRHHFNDVLDQFLEMPALDAPVDPDYGDETLCILLRNLEEKNVRCYNYLSRAKARAFIWQIWAFYRVTVRTELTKLILLKVQKQDAIAIFMEKYHIPEASQGMIEKDYQRHIKLTSKKRLLRIKKNLSV
jgi:hypothetical protein